MYLRRLLAALLAVCALIMIVPFAKADGLTEQGAHDAMLALRAQYPEGTPWDNSNFYAWHGGIFSGGYGCAGFAFMLSDAAFGTLPARQTDVVYGELHVGDILRMNNDQHSVIILEVHEDHVVVAEGNYNYSVHWGRHISRADVEAGDYVLTRWPVGYFDVTTGDVDGSGTVNSADALITLRASMGLTTLSAAQTSAADVNGDGSVTSMDALIILRSAMGLTQF